MDNPDPQRHRPEAFEWRWGGCGTALEVGLAVQITRVTLGDWERLVKLLGPQGRALADRIRAGSAGLRACGCGSPEVVRYRQQAGEAAQGYCRECWRREDGVELPAEGAGDHW